MTLTGNNVITLRKLTSKVTAEKGIPLNDLDFADDIPLLKSSFQGLSHSFQDPLMPQQTHASSSSHRRLNMWPSTVTLNFHFMVFYVSDFRYLGPIMESSANDLKRRKSLAWTAFLETSAPMKKSWHPNFKQSQTVWYNLRLWIMGHLQGYNGR